MDVLDKIIAIIIAIILLFIFPILYLAQKQDSIIQSFVLSETAFFVDTVKNTGKITPSIYESFIKSLDNTGNIYNIEIEHKHYEVIPLYEGDVFLNEYSDYYYSTYEKTILDELYKDDGSKGDYTFNQGDYISVRITNKNKTYGSKLQEIIYNTVLPTEQIFVVYGGAIRDEVD